MSNGNWIKLNRSILEWEWYDDINTKVLFIHLLITVNYEPKKWHGITIDRGQRVVSLAELAEETGLSIRNVRTAFSHLKSTGEVTKEMTNTLTGRVPLVTIENYNKYQSVDFVGDKASDTQTDTHSDKRPTSDRQATDNNLRNKERQERKEFKNLTPKPPYGEIVGHLNMRLGTSYKDNTKKTREHINARFAEGFTLDDFKTVIDKKCVEWANDDKMAKFLRPETLFGTKFESYLNAPVAKREESLWERIERGDFDE